MKKSILFIIAAIVIIAGIAAAIFAFKVNDSVESQRAKVEDILFLHLNPQQLSEKGAFDKYITPEQRRMWATIATANIADKEVAENIQGIISDFGNSGIDMSKPIYAYLDEMSMTIVVVAEIADINVVEKSIYSISYILKQQFNTSVNIEQNKDGGKLAIDKHAMVSYNNERIVVAFNEKGNIDESIVAACSRQLADLSIFGNSDIALYANPNRIVDFVISNVNKKIEKYSNDENYAEYISEWQTTKSIMEKIKAKMSDDAYIITDLTFEAGRATLSYNGSGLNFAEFDMMFNHSNNSHLQYISKDAIMVMNMWLDGKMVSEQIETFINGEVAELMNFEFTNESRMILALACDAIESINGDTTIALQTIDGEVVERLNYFTGKIEMQPVLRTAEVAVMMDVADSYIIQNIGQYTMGLLPKIGENHYMGQFAGNTITLKQQDGLLYAGLNMAPEQASHPATEAEWYNDIKNARYYVVVDVDNLMNIKFMESVNEIMIKEIEFNYRDMYTSLTKMFSYIYCVSDKFMQCNTVVVFDDKQTNSLEQLSSVFIPVICRNINSTIF